MFKFLTLIVTVVSSFVASFGSKPESTPAEPEPAYVTYKFDKKLTQTLNKFEVEFDDEEGAGIKAVNDWLNSDDYNQGLGYFNQFSNINVPAEYNAEVLQECKNGFYVVVTATNFFLNNYTTSVDEIRCILDHVIAAKDYIIGFLDHVTEEGTGEIEETFWNFYGLYHLINDTVTEAFYIGDVTPEEEGRDDLEIHYMRFRNFMIERSKYLEKHIDDSTNPLRIAKNIMSKLSELMANGSELNEKRLFNDISLEFYRFVNSNKMLTSDVEVLSGINPDEYITWDYIEDEDKYLSCYKHIYDPIFHFFTQMTFALSGSSFNIDLIKCYVNNMGPACYKLLDFIEAIMYEGKVNTVVLKYEFSEDSINLYGVASLEDNESEIKAYRKSFLTFKTIFSYIFF